jgi:FMN phosphatase YigB (HAD superfamily)
MSTEIETQPRSVRWIFLDIEGVLVPKSTPAALTADDLNKSCQFDPACQARLERVLREHTDVLVAITSAWKKIYHFEKVRSLFSPDIADRIMGFTPDLRVPSREWVRYKEMMRFLDARNEVGALWVALDDRTRHYSAQRGDPVIIVDNGEIGLSDSDADRLKQKLKLWPLTETGCLTDIT